MNQRDFISRYAASWEEYERVLAMIVSRRELDAGGRAAAAAFPAHYRRLTEQLSLARDRNYSAALIERLNALAVRGHHVLHRAPRLSGAAIARFVFRDFPARVRRDAGFVAFAAACLVLPAAAMFAAAAVDDALLYAFLDPAMAAELAEMYDPASTHYARERDSDSDFLMFGYYIRNNIGIGFQTFATGLFLGLGSVFYLVFNGLFFGAAAAHILALGFGTPFFSFVATHSAFELTAIVIAGAAGLKLGHALLAPGRQARGRALVHAASESAVLVTGLAVMLLVAAFIEAFWSSSRAAPDGLKAVTGALSWIAVVGYFLVAGKTDGSREPYG